MALPLNTQELLSGHLVEWDRLEFKEGLHRIVNNLQPSASPRLRVNQTSSHG